MRRMFQSDLFTSAHRGGRTIVGRPLVPMSMTNRPLRAKVHSLYQSARTRIAYRSGLLADVERSVRVRAELARGHHVSLDAIASSGSWDHAARAKNESPVPPGLVDTAA